LRELIRVGADRSGVATLRQAAYDGRRLGVFALARDFDRAVARRLTDRRAPVVIHGYDDTSAETFERARSLGIRRVLELPFAHYRYARRVFETETARNPEFAMTHRVERESTVEELERKDRELAAADVVVVPSEPVAKSLTGIVDHCRIVVNPYGMAGRQLPPRPDDGERRPLKLIFVGRLQLDKGIAYLADAWTELNRHCSLTVIGSRPPCECARLDRFLSSVRYLGTAPRPAVLKELARADAFVLPSLVEGRSLAALEAIGSGAIPLVTWSSGVADLVTDGRDGFLLKEGSVQSIVEKVSQLFDPRRRMAFRREVARRRPGKSWDDYERRAADLVNEMR
jgi:glycosyltransferase involved in cell wall biosynthesis